MNEIIKKDDHILIKTDSGEYHYSIDEFNRLGEDAAVKFAIEQIAKKNLFELDETQINLDIAHSRFGFCVYGIKDFCEITGLDINKTYSLDNVHRKLSLEVIKKYPNEIVKLFKGETFKYLGGNLVNLNPDTIYVFLGEEFIEENDLHELACRFAESVLHIFEEIKPNDKRPRLAIEAKRKWLNKEISDDELTTARYAAGSAARAAGYAATWAAAWAAESAASWAAGYAAEKEKQVEMIEKYLK